jgi:hypothetical protein
MFAVTPQIVTSQVNSQRNAELNNGTDIWHVTSRTVVVKSPKRESTKKNDVES